jgi:hypothetical protein
MSHLHDDQNLYNAPKSAHDKTGVMIAIFCTKGFEEWDSEANKVTASAARPGIPPLSIPIRMAEANNIIKLKYYIFVLLLFYNLSPRRMLSISWITKFNHSNFIEVK